MLLQRSQHSPQNLIGVASHTIIRNRNRNRSTKSSRSKGGRSADTRNSNLFIILEQFRVLPLCTGIHEQFYWEAVQADSYKNQPVWTASTGRGMICIFTVRPLVVQAAEGSSAGAYFTVQFSHNHVHIPWAYLGS